MRLSFSLFRFLRGFLHLEKLLGSVWAAQTSGTRIGVGRPRAGHASAWHETLSFAHRSLRPNPHSGRRQTQPVSELRRADMSRAAELANCRLRRDEGEEIYPRSRRREGRERRAKDANAEEILQRRVAAACSFGCEDASRHVACRHGESVRSVRIFAALCSVLPGGDFRHPSPLDRGAIEFDISHACEREGKHKICRVLHLLDPSCFLPLNFSHPFAL